MPSFLESLPDDDKRKHTTNPTTALNATPTVRQHFTTSGKLTFGKHRGKSYKEVLFKDPSWIKWAGLNIDGFKEAVAALNKPVKPKPKPKRQTKEQAAATAAFNKLTHNERLAMIAERVRAREWMDEPLVHGFLDSFTAFDPKTAPY